MSLTHPRHSARMGALVLLTALAAACASGPGGGPGGGDEGGGARGGPRGGPGAMGGPNAGYGLMAREEVPRDAATIALRFRNELALTDSQITAFSRIRSTLDSSTATLRKQLDTLVVDPRAVNGSSADERARTQAKLRERAGVIRQLKEQVQDVRATVLLALSERQRTQMQIIEDAMKTDTRPGIGGPGGGRRGGTGRPPA